MCFCILESSGSLSVCLYGHNVLVVLQRKWCSVWKKLADNFTLSIFNLYWAHQLKSSTLKQILTRSNVVSEWICFGSFHEDCYSWQTANHLEAIKRQCFNGANYNNLIIAQEKTAGSSREIVLLYHWNLISKLSNYT